jgi:hypothetical protein
MTLAPCPRAGELVTILVTISVAGGRKRQDPKSHPHELATFSAPSAELNSRLGSCPFAGMECPPAPKSPHPIRRNTSIIAVQPVAPVALMAGAIFVALALGFTTETPAGVSVWWGMMDYPHLP